MNEFKYDNNYPSVLYKYFPINLRGFFETFSLRVTQRGSLNDPFEKSSVNRDEFENFSDVEKNAFLSEVSNNNRYSASLVEKILLKKFEEREDAKNGVISFCETPDNLLLWSLYASNHRGFCVEFNASYFNGYENGVKSNSHSLQRVLYRDSRFDMQIRGLHNYLFKSSDKKILNTKSTHWIHEHEWRVFRSLNADDLSLLKCPDGNFRTDDFGSNIYLQSVPKKHILKVIFGASCDINDIFYIKNKIKNDQELSHVVKKLAAVDPIDFKLRLVNIKPDDFSKFEGN